MKNTKHKSESKKLDNKKLLIFGGTAVTIIVVLIGIAAWMLVSGMFQGEGSGFLDYYAQNPNALQSRLNREARSGFNAIAAADFSQLMTDPASVISEGESAGNLALDYDIAIDVASPKSNNPYSKSEFSLDGVAAYVNQKLELDGKFDIKMGDEAASLGFGGEYMVVNNVIYADISNAAKLLGDSIPQGWLSIDYDEVVTSLSKYADFEEETTELKNFQGSVFANAKSIDNKTIGGVSLPCAQIEYSQEYIDFAYNSNSDNVSEFSYTPFIICANGSENPFYYEMVLTEGEGTKETNVTIQVILQKLMDMPEFVAPEVSTPVNQLLGDINSFL